MSPPAIVQDEQHQRLEVKLRRELGDTVLRLLDDNLTEDILLNPDGSLWVKRMGHGFSRIGEMPKLANVGLGWANFLVMRRTHATLMRGLGVDGKLVADQLGHSLDVSQNVYTQSPVESRLAGVNQLEKSLAVM